MDSKINVADILRHKPKGTRLYDRETDSIVLFDHVSATNGKNVIWCTRCEGSAFSYYTYSEFGTACGCPDGIMLLAPSRDMQDWAKFAQKWHEFKPFDRVLVRDDDEDTWRIGIFSHMLECNPVYPYCVICTTSAPWTQCIPYEGNEHLFGTTDKPKD